MQPWTNLVMSSTKFVLKEKSTAQIPVVAEQIAEWLQQQKVTQSIIQQMNLCLDELLTNTINYGFKDFNTTPEITIELRLITNELIIEIIDNATPFNPLKEVDPPNLEAPLDERPIGGLGVHFVKTLTDSVKYHSDDLQRNHLLLNKLLDL